MILIDGIDFTEFVSTFMRLVDSGIIEKAGLTEDADSFMRELQERGI